MKKLCYAITVMALTAMAGAAPRQALASCNIIPSARLAFRAPVGAANKPFAAPGDFVELSVPENRCKVTSGVLDPAANNNVVTVVYTPPLKGTRRAVIVSAHACATPEVSPQFDACAALLGVDNVDCAPPSALSIVDRDGTDHLSFRFPDAQQTKFLSDLAGPAMIAVTPVSTGACGFATTNCATQSSGVTACVDSLFANDGTCQPNLHPTFPGFTALPPANDYSADCFGTAIECTASATEVRSTIDSAGNFLLPVNWQGILLRQNNQPIPRIVRASLHSPVSFLTTPPLEAFGSYTPEGARLPPVFEPRNDPNGSTAPDTVSIYGTADAAYTILRVARRYRTCVGANVGAPCAGDADCGGGTCPFRCVGGSTPDAPCDSDNDCSGGSCGTLIFADPRPQAKNGTAITILRAEPEICQLDPHDQCNDDTDCGGVGDPCVGYSVEANQPVLLEGTSCSDEICTFPVNERAALQEINQDADQTDVVLTLQDRESGRSLPIGPPGPEQPLGRAITLVRKDASRFAAVDTEADLAAFLEPEAIEGTTTNADATTSTNDENGDGDSFDTILRVFERAPDGESATEVTAGFTPPIAADADLRINGRSLAVSGGRVFFRTAESADASHTTIHVSRSDTDAPADEDSRTFEPGRIVSDDGRFIVFGSNATNLVTGLVVLVNEHVYVRDRDFDGNGILDESPPDGTTTTELVSKTALDAPGNGQSSAPSISGDGRFVAFVTIASNLAPGLPATCPNGVALGVGPCIQVVVKDRQDGDVEVVTPGFGGGYGDGDSFPTQMTADGRYVVFMSTAGNFLAPGVDNNDVCDNALDGTPNQSCKDAYVYDRCESYGEPVPSCASGIERVTLDHNDQQINGASHQATISDDGRYVAFQSGVSFWPGDGGLETVFARDRELDETILVSDSGVPNFGQGAWVSRDGRVVSFDSTFSYTPPGAGSYSAYVRNLVTGTFEHSSQNTEGVLGGAQYGAGPFSRDGRYTLFYGAGTNLASPTTNICNGGLNPDCASTFVRDRLSGLTQRATESESGGEIQGNARIASISGDGQTVTFTTDAQDVVSDDTKLCVISGPSDPCPDIFAWTLDWSQAGALDRSGDGIFDDTILEAIDASGTRTPLCPANDVAVANGRAAFLRPEHGGATTLAKLPDCPVGVPSGLDTDLNGDTDEVDEVVHLWTGGGVINLARAAVAVAISDTHVAAIDEDGTLATYPILGGVWNDTGTLASSIQFCGDVVALLADDGEVKFHEPGGPVVSTGQIAHEIVCNDALAAFRTPESVDMNNDGDPDDDVLQTWPLTPECLPGDPVDCLGSSEQAVTPCLLDACAPSTPYRVQGDTVKFLTLECAQGDGAETDGCADPGGARDLNEDGDAADIVIQVYDTIADTVTPYGTVSDGNDPLGSGEAGGGAGGSTYSASGRCIEFSNACASNAECSSPAFCNATTEVPAGNCGREHGVCVTNADCPPLITCVADGTVPASRDSDVDGIPDHLDNCPDNPNSGQQDIDADGAGDPCDVADCGDNFADYDEQCDGTDDQACPAACVECACTADCPNSISDPNPKAVLKTRNEAGQLAAKFVVDLPFAYTDQPVTIQIDDSDPDPVASQPIGALAAAGSKFQFKTKDPGVQKVLLKAGKLPGQYKFSAKAKKWFTAAAADETTATTELTLRIGSSCFLVPMTDKVE